MDDAEKQRIAAIKAAWHSDKTKTKIQREFGISYEALQRMAAKYHWRRKAAAPRQKDDDESGGPSPEEIAQRAADIRARWTPKDHAKRWVGLGRVAWTPRQYSYDPNTGFLNSEE